MVSVGICIGIIATVTAAHATQTNYPGGGQHTPYPASHTSPSVYSAVTVSSERVSRAIARLDAVAQDVLKRSSIPGMAVAVVQGEELLFEKGFGVRRIDSALPVDAQTVFQLASLSKPIGATVIATQVDQEKVTWDTPISKLLPWFRLSDPWVSKHVTIADLYAHRSGLPDHAGDDLEDLGYGREEILRRLRLIPLKPFRAHYAYTNFGITAAAQSVAQAAGTDWATLSRDALYEPLGMHSTSSRHADYMAQANRASGHILAKNGTGYQVSDLRQPDAQSPAGGVSSNIRDVARWMQMVLQNGQYENSTIIAKEALLPAITPKMITGQPSSPAARAASYGYGFNVGVQPSGRVMLGHSGGFYLGTGTTFAMIPSLDLGIVVLTNASPIGAAEAVSATFMDMAQFGHVTRDWLAAYQPVMAPLVAPAGELVGALHPSSPTPPQSMQTYAGTYQNDYFGDIEVRSQSNTAQSDSLSLVIGPGRDVKQLSHWDGNTFTFIPFNENAPIGSISKVQFEDIRKGQAQRVSIELLNENNLGTFTRKPR
ncbi:serine hydrolase [Orrella marina]|uniref:Serine hydrolase n=2 Tax=Orrella marina TaxID=2163011 RepID=A0A2R4XPG2_9BURK|nr:serine hydrolase [Orrella marina]